MLSVYRKTTSTLSNILRGMMNIKVICGRKIDFANYKRIRKPIGMNRNIKNSYSDEYTSGIFKFNMYAVVSNMYKITLYIRSVIRFVIPIVMTHLFLLGFLAIVRLILGEAETAPLYPVTRRILILVTLIRTATSARHITDHIAHVNGFMAVNKYYINRATLLQMNNQTISDREMEILKSHRETYNKVVLFPNVKEQVIVHQRQKPMHRIFHAITLSTNDGLGVKSKAIEKINLRNKREEHMAARLIANMVQFREGGENEYDKLVEKYILRTTPEIKHIVQDVQFELMAPNNRIIDMV